MKLATVLLGACSFLLICLGVLLKVQEFSGAFTLLFTGYLILVGPFNISNFIWSIKKNGSLVNIILSVISFFTIGTVFTAILLKIIHIPGQKFLWTLSILLLLLFYLPLQLVKIIQNRVQIGYENVAIILAVLAFGVMSYGMQPQEKSIYQFQGSANTLHRTNKYFEKRNDNLYNILRKTEKAQKIEQFYIKQKWMLSYLSSLKLDLIGSDPSYFANEAYQVSGKVMSEAGNRDFVTYTMLGLEKDEFMDHEFSALSLKLELEKYISFVEDNTNIPVSELIIFDSFDDRSADTWEEMHFKNATLISVVNYLNLLENQLLMIGSVYYETECLKG